MTLLYLLLLLAVLVALIWGRKFLRDHRIRVGQPAGEGGSREPVGRSTPTGTTNGRTVLRGRVVETASSDWEIATPRSMGGQSRVRANTRRQTSVPPASEGSDWMISQPANRSALTICPSCKRTMARCNQHPCPYGRAASRTG